MKYNPDQHHRQSVRLKHYDYSQSGIYFVTICTFNRECLFGDIENGTMVLNDIGSLIASEWKQTESVRSYITLDSFVVMPNHIHGIIAFNGRGTPVACPDVAKSSPNQGTPPACPYEPKFGKPIKHSLPTIIGQFKSITTKRINENSNLGPKIWQRNYHEHVVRDESSLEKIREYILANPENWDVDEMNIQSA